MPKAYRFSAAEVIVKYFGNGMVLLPIEDPWQTLEAARAAFEPGIHLRDCRMGEIVIFSVVT